MSQVAASLCKEGVEAAGLHPQGSKVGPKLSPQGSKVGPKLVSLTVDSIGPRLVL